ncbi:MAG TPA: pyridoxamine 5'-phosphate oxidase family protein [Methanobacteriaceae archaeon]|nr:pyridoxamine 5'-phosphate oxidase family protein [Methanobacteriaceae archaeon]
MMNEEMMEIIEKERAYVATATPEGVPNVVPIGFIKPLDDKTVIIADSYMIKTRANLEANPKVAFVVQDAARYPYQFKGSAEIFTDGEHFDLVVEWVKEVNPLAPKPKSAVVITIDEIYSVKVGDAGKKIA